jgi:formamidopyrimidine-DNA glycosylase
MATHLGMARIAASAPGGAMPDKIQASFDLDNGRDFRYTFGVRLYPLGAHDRPNTTWWCARRRFLYRVSPGALRQIIAGRRTRIKSLLLDQSVIAGIGNFYAHDVLYRARLHPLRPANTLGDSEIEALWRGIRETLQVSINLGGAKFEQNLYGQGGRFDAVQLLIGYKEGQPCPACGATIAKIQTGSTAGFICPSCQTL